MLLSSAHFEVQVVAARKDVDSADIGFCHIAPVTSSSVAPGESTKARKHEYEPLLFRRAFTNDSYLFDWRRHIVDGESDLRDVSIRVYSDSSRSHGTELRLRECWPVRWSGPTLDAIEGGVAYEEIELAFNELIWVRG